jgi:hypothetical protein
MSKSTQTNSGINKLPDFQRRLVEKLAAEAKPYQPVPSVLTQWLVWLLFALLVAVVSLSVIGPQFEIMERLTDPASGGFLLLAFALSALTAWMGIASSMPNHRPRLAPRLFAAALILFLFTMPFLFFDRDSLSQVWATNMADGWFCVRTVVLVAFPSWVMLGWMASRNASFYPGWTGAWLGASAFLLGTGTIQLHCAHWETCHMLVDHLLPLLLLIFIPIWIGSFWFSRWTK